MDLNRARLKRAVFLDRDGTLNIEKGYLFRLEDWEWTGGALQAIKRFNELQLLVVVVTNQAGIARGLYKAEDVDHLHVQIRDVAAKEGARIDAFYYCPHHPDYGDRLACDCRKPKAGLLYSAERDFGIDLASSFLVGDKAIDIQAAKSAGVKPLLTLTGYGHRERAFVGPGTPIVGTLIEAAELISAMLTSPSSSRQTLEHPHGIERVL